MQHHKASQGIQRKWKELIPARPFLFPAPFVFISLEREWERKNGPHFSIMFVRLDTTEAIFKYAELHTAQKKKNSPRLPPPPFDIWIQDDRNTLRTEEILVGEEADNAFHLRVINK